MENKEKLVKQLFRFDWLVRRKYMRNRGKGGPFGDTIRGQGRVLALLKMQPEISQRDLSYLLDMRPQSLGELLAKLEASGYITRSVSEDDRRVMIIRLTDAGKAAASEGEGQFAFAGEVFACLTDEELTNLGNYLDKIIKQLETDYVDGGEDEYWKRRDIFMKYGEKFDRFADDFTRRFERFGDDLGDHIAAHQRDWFGDCGGPGGRDFHGHGPHGHWGGGPGHDGERGDDALLRYAAEFGLERGVLSVTMLQYRFSIGYGRAARLLAELEKTGVVGPANGTSPRKVLITREQYEEMFKHEGE